MSTTPTLTLSIKTPSAAFELTVASNVTGQGLKEEIAKLSAIPPPQQKVLIAGKFLKDEETLDKQSVKNNAKIMVMLKPIGELPTVIEKKKEEASRIDKILKMAEQMAAREASGDAYYFEITNQDGRKVDLPAATRKGLTLGLSLHDRGKKEIDTGNVASGLEYLLAADKAFSGCETEYLKLVDNYGFLCLDIAWAYFLTQNLEFLQDAAWRLSKAEEAFNTSYGANQERLLRLKGGCCPERIVYVRLYLLYSVVNFHQGRWQPAKKFLDQSNQILLEMSISDQELLPLVEMGYEPREARIALRAANKIPDKAIQFISEKKDKIAQVKEEERQRRTTERRQRLFGRCANGKSFVDLALLKELQQMGFEKLVVVEGLKQTNNNKDATVALLLANSQVLQASASANFVPSATKIKEVTDVGFSASQAEKALKCTLGHVENAVTLLLTDEEFALSALQDVAPAAPASDPAPAPAPAAAAEAANPEDPEDVAMKEENEALEKEVIDGLAEEDAYLDISLSHEAEVIGKYLALLGEKGFK